MENQHQEQLPIDNLDKLKEEVKMTGFNNYFDPQIEKKIKSGQTEFQLGRRIEVEGSQIDYLLHFRVDKERRKAYFNNMDATLKIPESGQERRHSFPRYLRITAKEAFNLLKYGEDTAVTKSLFNKKGELYHSFITLDLKGNKDERNNYPLKQYHEKYYKEKPFLLEKAIDELPVPVKELEDPVTKDHILSSLRRGNRQQVTFYNNGVVEPGYLMVNAREGKMDVRDSNMQLIKGTPKEMKAENTPQQAQTDPGEIKKKHGTKRKVSRPSGKKSKMKL